MLSNLRNERFQLWAGLNLLGFLPSAMTLLVHFLSRGQMAAAKVEDLMFSVIMMVAATTMDLVLINMKRALRILCTLILILFTIFATGFLWANLMSEAFLRDSPMFDRDLLRLLSFGLTICALLSTFAIEVFITKDSEATKGMAS